MNLTDDTRAVMLPLSGRPAGQITIILAERVAAALQHHQRDESGAACQSCRDETWPCRTYRYLTGRVSVDE